MSEDIRKKIENALLAAGKPIEVAPYSVGIQMDIGKGEDNNSYHVEGGHGFFTQDEVRAFLKGLSVALSCKWVKVTAIEKDGVDDSASFSGWWDPVEGLDIITHQDNQDGWKIVHTTQLRQDEIE